jgi:hypothetical protein
MEQTMRKRQHLCGQFNRHLYRKLLEFRHEPEVWMEKGKSVDAFFGFATDRAQ